jgi:hypothetical protein
MIKFFRQSYAIQYVVIALMAIALWIPAFLSGQAITGLESPVTPLFNLVNRLLGFSVIAQYAFAFLLIVLEALLFNAVLINNQITGKVGTMAAFVFVLLMSLTCTQTQFYPFALATLFIVLMLKAFFEVHLSPNPEMSLLNAGLLIALASMCYFPAILLVVWAIIVLPMARKGSFRLALIPLLGFLAVYFLYFVGVFLFGNLKTVGQEYLGYFVSFHLTVAGFNYKIIILLSLLILSAVFLLFGGNKANLEKSVAVRTKISMMVVMLVFAVFLLFIGGNPLMHGLLFLVLSVLFAYAFSYMGNTGWANLLLTMFLILVFVNHYYFKTL